MSASSFGLGEELYDYLIEQSVREPAVLAELRRRTSELAQSGWRTSPEQAQFMGLLAQIAGVRRYLEIGTFTGYGTLWMAMALPTDGEIITCDLTDEFAKVGQPLWEEAGVASKIDFRIGPAFDTINDILRGGGAGSFDMTFIDADKETYPEYYEQCIELVRPGGLILVDNVLWSGRVIDPEDQQSSTVAIRKINERIRDDQRVSLSTLPVGDGLTIARRLP